VDIPPSVSEIREGACSEGIVARGKQAPAGPAGSRQGLNDYTSWFSADKDMSGQYFGYDGPCPPWNDELLHHYHFVLYATDLARCPVEGAFTGQQVEQAIAGHVLAEARLTGLTLSTRRCAEPRRCIPLSGCREQVRQAQDPDEGNGDEEGGEQQQRHDERTSPQSRHRDEVVEIVDPFEQTFHRRRVASASLVLVERALGLVGPVPVARDTVQRLGNDGLP